MDEAAILATITIPWQRMQLLLDLLVRELKKGASASEDKLPRLASAAQSVFKGPIENNIPAGAASPSAYSNAKELAVFLAGIGRRTGDTSEAAERERLAKAFGDWIEANSQTGLRQQMGGGDNDWAAIESETVCLAIATVARPVSERDMAPCFRPRAGIDVQLCASRAN